jgi:hypothetical protein
MLAATKAPDAGGAQIALVNVSGVRVTLPAGDVRYADAFSMMPFGNNLVVMTLTGAQLKAVLEQQYAGTNRASGKPSALPRRRVLPTLSTCVALSRTGWWRWRWAACRSIPRAAIALSSQLHGLGRRRPVRFHGRHGDHRPGYHRPRRFGRVDSQRADAARPDRVKAITG